MGSLNFIPRLSDPPLTIFGSREAPTKYSSYLPSRRRITLFFSFFKTLVGKEIAVELKNDVVLTGTLHSVDQYLNIKLTNVSVVNKDKYPQLTALKNCFIRGSVVRYVQINPNDVDTELLQDATRKEYSPVTGGEK
eukprot:CCRYP_018831-RA/>CCRYP_018831-RA protein AED:0.42 eAED:0.42 QI:0/0/0.5/1/0/0/2/1005/135